MTKDILGIDYETFSRINLKRVGAQTYARHESTEVLMTAWALNDGPVCQWLPAEGEPMPDDLAEMLVDPEVIKVAWNAPFEMAVTAETLGIDVDVRQWRDTMVWAMHLSMPGGLEKVGEIVGIPSDKAKDRRGKALIRKFCVPQKPLKRDPNRTRIYWHDDLVSWNEFCAYNRTDVEAERAIRLKLDPYRMPQSEWEVWFLDQKINLAGVPINLAMVDNAITIYEKEWGDNDIRMREITGLRNPNSGQQLLPWLQEQGYMFDDLKAGHIRRAKEAAEVKPEHWSVEKWEEYGANRDLAEVLTMRGESSRTSIKKYYALREATDPVDGVIRGTLQMNGAQRTCRWAGRLFQPQNLPRPDRSVEDVQAELAHAIEHLDGDALRLVFGNPFDCLASALRPVAQAPDGFVFIDCDLNAIENRVLGWMAECDKILEVFRLKRDPYISFATYLYGIDYDTLWHEYKVLRIGAKRQIAKPGTLGSGYQMGAGKVIVNEQTGEIEATGLLGYAWNMGVKNFTLEDSQHSIEVFRREFKEVKDYWYGIERAAIDTVVTKKSHEAGPVSFDLKGPFLRMRLPSGRFIWYMNPQVKKAMMPWGKEKLQLSYMNQNDKGQWARTSTHGGKLTENADQAISRDLLVHGMMLADREGLDVRLHVHDQIVGLAREDDAERQKQVLVECMETQPSWAKDLPLGTGSLITKVFIKD